MPFTPPPPPPLPAVPPAVPPASLPATLPASLPASLPATLPATRTPAELLRGPSSAGPNSNGAMEERYTLGLEPFTNEYPDPDPEPSLPIFPILGAQRSLERLLSEEALVRKLIKAGMPTGDVQSPPVLSPLLFERLEARAADPAALREAARAYVRDARDADELFGFAQRSRRLGSQAEAAQRTGEAAVRDAEVDGYLDKALLACELASQALARVVALLPRPANAAEQASALVQQQESLRQFRR